MVNISNNSYEAFCHIKTIYWLLWQTECALSLQDHRGSTELTLLRPEPNNSLLLMFLTKQASSKTLHLHTRQSEPDRVIGWLCGDVIKRGRSEEGGRPMWQPQRNDHFSSSAQTLGMCAYISNSDFYRFISLGLIFCCLFCFSCLLEVWPCKEAGPGLGSRLSGTEGGAGTASHCPLLHAV